MNCKPYAIGVLGGMGTYATIHLFRQYAEVFPAEKEWERPRIIIDNRCTMPSRVRAALYGEERDRLVGEMSESVSNLMRSGCDRILLACNTAHLFLPEIYHRIPEAEGRIRSIIETCVDGISEDGISEVFLLASEGTIESGIYQKACEARGIRCETPGREEYALLRDCIEAVKRNRYPDTVAEKFSELVRRGRVCILGCTELPVLYEKYEEFYTGIRVYDPVCMSLAQCGREYRAKAGQAHSAKAGRKVLTFGVFDYFHIGHLRLFQQCREHGNHLIVGVQNDAYVSRFKPGGECFYSTEERRKMIEALRIVDEVFVYDTLGPDVMEKTDFDVLALGEDHIGARFDAIEQWCREHGRSVVRLKRTSGISSSSIKARLDQIAGEGNEKR